MAAKKAKAKRKTLGHMARPKEITVSYVPGAIVVDDAESAKNALEMMEQAKADIKPVLDFIEQARKAAQHWAVVSATKVIQLEEPEVYYRKIQRTSRFWVASPADMPSSKPKGAKSLREICEGKKVKAGKKMIPLWNFITKRVPDPDKINEAVARGFLTEKEVGKAYLETTGDPFIQRFEGEAVDA